MSAHGNPVGLMALLYVAGGALLWSAWTRQRTAQRLRDTARSKAATAPQGRVELEGAAWALDGDILRSPGGAEVVYYALQIQREEERGVGKNRRKTWVTVFERKHSPDFYLVDATAAVCLNAARADLDLSVQRTRAWRSMTDEERERLLTFAQGHGIANFPPSSSFFGVFETPYRVIETEIPLGSPLYAHGYFRTGDTLVPPALRSRGLTAFHEKFFDPSTREARDLREAVGAATGRAPTAFDVGEGMRAAAQIARELAAKPDVVEQEFPVAGRLGSGGGQTLLLADRLEEHLVAEKSRGNMLRAAGGVLALVAAWNTFTWVPWIGTFTSGVAKSPAVRLAAPAPAPAPSPANPVAGAHEALRSRCLARFAPACEELLRRADELRIPDAFRRDYARMSCSLGNPGRCPESFAQQQAPAAR